MGYISHSRQHLLEIAWIVPTPRIRFLMRPDHVLLPRALRWQMQVVCGKMDFWRGSWEVGVGSQGFGVSLCLPFADNYQVSAMVHDPSLLLLLLEYGFLPPPHVATRANPPHPHPDPAPSLHTLDCDCSGADLPCVDFLRVYVLHCGRLCSLEPLVSAQWLDYGWDQAR